MVFFKRASQNCAQVFPSVALVFAFFVLWLVPAGAIAQQQTQTPQVIERIDVIGNRRIPRESVTSRIYTREGDIYDPAALEAAMGMSR